MNVIECSHLQKSFGTFAIQDLTLSIPQGAICGLIGENGAGKSTLIRLLMGALRPDGGTISVLGTEVSSPDFYAVREQVGVVLDESCFPSALNAIQAGKVLARTYRQWDADAYAAYIQRFHLPLDKPLRIIPAACG